MLGDGAEARSIVRVPRTITRLELGPRLMGIPEIVMTWPGVSVLPAIKNPPDGAAVIDCPTKGVVAEGMCMVLEPTIRSPDGPSETRVPCTLTGDAPSATAVLSME